MEFISSLPTHTWDSLPHSSYAPCCKHDLRLSTSCSVILMTFCHFVFPSSRPFPQLFFCYICFSATFPHWNPTEPLCFRKSSDSQSTVPRPAEDMRPHPLAVPQYSLQMSWVSYCYMYFLGKTYCYSRRQGFKTNTLASVISHKINVRWAWGNLTCISWTHSGTWKPAGDVHSSVPRRGRS